MPRITTLSLMPFAISSLLGAGRHRRGLPIVASEAARGIDVLDAEHHLHRLAHAQRVGIDVGEVDHHPAALLELDHAVAGRRIRRIGEDRKSTRLNSSHVAISYAVFCLKKKNKIS